MSAAILEYAATIQSLYQITGLTQWHVERKSLTVLRKRFLEIYSIIIICCSVAMLLIGLFTDEDFNQSTENDIWQTVDFIQLLGIRVAHLLSIIEVIARREEQRQLYEKFFELDRLIEFSLNVNIYNSNFRRRTLQAVAIVFIIHICSKMLACVIQLFDIEQEFSLFWLLYMPPFLVCCLRYFQIFIAISIIKNHFELLISELSQVNLQLHNSTTTFESTLDTSKLPQQRVRGVPIFETAKRINRRFEMENPQLKKLLVIRDIYNRLWELTGLLNRCIGVSMLINIGNDFLCITSSCYYIFLNYYDSSATFLDNVLSVGYAVCSAPHLLNVLVLAILCDRTVHSTTEIALALHRIEIDSLNDNHNTVIEQFSLQLLHQKIVFTAAGFFNVDSTLLYTIVGATTTYLIILIQFHLNEQIEN